jgi:hypothetical protein
LIMKVKDSLRPNAGGSHPNCIRHPIERPPRSLCLLTRNMILRERTPFRKNRERERAREIIQAATSLTCFIETRKFGF